MKAIENMKAGYIRMNRSGLGGNSHGANHWETHFMEAENGSVAVEVARSSHGGSTGKVRLQDTETKAFESREAFGKWLKTRRGKGCRVNAILDENRMKVAREFA